MVSWGLLLSSAAWERRPSPTKDAEREVPWTRARAWWIPRNQCRGGNGPMDAAVGTGRGGFEHNGCRRDRSDASPRFLESTASRCRWGLTVFIFDHSCLIFDPLQNMISSSFPGSAAAQSVFSPIGHIPQKQSSAKPSLLRRPPRERGADVGRPPGECKPGETSKNEVESSSRDGDYWAAAGGTRRRNRGTDATSEGG